MMNKGNKAFNAAEKIIVLLGLGIILISMLFGYWEYALGVVLAAPIALFFYRWQMAAVNLEGSSPQKVTISLVIRSVLRQFIFLGMVGFSFLGGKIFFFGVVTGLLLQMLAFTGQAFFIMLGKEG